MTDVRPPGADELARVDAALPLSRLDRSRSEYLVAWDGGEPVGHVCIE